MEAGGVQRAGDAGAGRPGGEETAVHHLPRLDPAPDEREAENALPDRWGKVVRQQGRGIHADAQGLSTSLPECGEAAR
ncbi:hypothetical protein D3C77_655090 [compost metagenome]